MSTSIAVVDSTVQLEWKITKEEFDNHDYSQVLASPIFNVKIDKQETKWEIRMYPRGDSEERKNKVNIYLKNRGKDSHMIKYDFAIETQDGYWPIDPIKTSYTSIPQMHTQEYLTILPNKTRGYSIGSTQVVSGKFYNEKITIVAILAIFGKGQKYLEHKKATSGFVKNLRSISDLGTLANVTLVCQGKRIQCHKNVLAAMSSFFKTKFTNGNFSDGRARVIKIEDSTSEIVEKMVKFVSNGLIPDDIDETARELIKLSTYYGIDSLTSVCEKSLIKTLSSQNVIETFIFFDKYLPTSEDRPKILEFIKANKAQVVATRDWQMFCSNHPNLVGELV